MTYAVLIILTDGNIHDMQQTKVHLVQMSKMPFSAVVVGIGNGEFTDMIELDADATTLTD